MAEWSMKSVSFLDTKVRVENEGCLTTNLYVKPTGTRQYLHRHSCHPTHCKRGMPYSHALRIRRICSEREDDLRRTQELKGFLNNWGYNEDEIQNQIDRTTGLNKEALLCSKRTKTPLERVPLIVTYHLGFPPLRGILDKHSSILHVSKNLRELAVRNSPFLANRRPPNLRPSLVQAQFAQQQQLSYKGNFWCQQVRCKTCRHIQPIKIFMSSGTGKTYPIKATANCKTANVVYVIKCKNVRNSMWEKQRTCSTYEWMAINQILNIDLWKRQWVDTTIPKATPYRIFLSLWSNKSTGRRRTFGKRKRAIVSRLSNHWSQSDLTSIHKPQNRNNDGPIDTIFHQQSQTSSAPLRRLWTT